MLIEETDVVVVGYGGAGAAAAIAAHDAGAKVLLIEKSERAGGNTRLSGGTLRELLDNKGAAQYLQAILDNTVSPAVTQAFVDETIKNSGWIKEIGGEVEKVDAGPQRFPPSPHVVWPHLPGAAGMGGRWNIIGNSKPGGTNLCNVMIKAIEKRGIKVLFNTAAKKLTTNDSKEVTGVIANSPKGEIQIKAKRGVILTCGGFQYNEAMQINFLGLKYLAQGCKGNTGMVSGCARK